MKIGWKGLAPDLWAITVFISVFCLYLSTLAPSVTFYDSGEFITAIHFMGSAHSPGYPLFLLYAKPFTWIPFGSIAFRVNLATAVSASLASLSVFFLVRRLLAGIEFCEDLRFNCFARDLAALSGALIFATSPRIWLQTNHDKPYPLVALIVSLAFICMLRWREEMASGNERPALWYVAAFISGLATGAHQTIILIVPAFLFFIMTVDRRMVLRGRELLLATAAGVAGSAVQLYLPLRAYADTMQNWGDAKALSRFLWHLLRRGYPEDPHLRDITLLIKQLSAFSIPNEFGWTGLLFLIVGAVACWRFNRPMIVACLAMLAAFWLLIAVYFNPESESIFLTEEFYTPLYLLASSLIAMGLYTLALRGSAAADRPDRYGWLHYSLIFCFFIIIPAFQAVSNYKENDQHKNLIAHDYAMNSIRSAPEKSVIFTWGDSGAFPLWYIQAVERMREDIDLPHIPHLSFAWYRKSLPRLENYYPQVIAKGTPAEMIFMDMAISLKDMRPVLMDYSTRHSVIWGEQTPCQQGMLFVIPEQNCGFGKYDYLVWDSFVLHRFSAAGGWKPDMDSDKAQKIVAHSMMQSAEAAGNAGNLGVAGRFLNQVERIEPSWRLAINGIRMKFNLHEVGGAEGGIR